MLFSKKPKNTAEEETAAADAAEQIAEDPSPDEVREVREVRHTISSEETFTLAKDIYDLRCVIKKVYDNRTQIARRLNILSLAFSLAFTAIYVALILYLGVTGSLSQGWTVAVYTILAVYAVIIIAFGACAYMTTRRGTARNYKRNGKILKVFRYLVRVASLVMSIVALAVALSEGAEDSLGLAMRTLALIIAIISMILALIPLIFGGLGGVARWVMSPTRVNKKFSVVVLEWYGDATAPSSLFASTGKVEKSRLEEIGKCVDDYILPALGRRRLSAIGTNQIFAAVEIARQEDRPTVEGILKNVFDYAVERGYVTANPCKDMKLEGSIEVYEKPKKESLKMRIGKKIGSSIIKQFLGEPKDKK